MLDIETRAADAATVMLHDEMPMTRFGGTWSLGASVQVHHVADQELTIVRKTGAGWRSSDVGTVRSLMSDIVAGRVGPCKFLVFDLAQGDEEPPRPAAGFADMVTELSDLIFQAPVISVAWVRQAVCAADLELALACSTMVAETGATFTFGADVTDHLRTYALLAHRIGFVQAERLMDGDGKQDALAMRDMLLLQAIVEPGPGFGGITDFVKSRQRRHNSACGIYRAQRIAMRGAI